MRWKRRKQFNFFFLKQSQSPLSHSWCDKIKTNHHQRHHRASFHHSIISINWIEKRWRCAFVCIIFKYNTHICSEWRRKRMVNEMCARFAIEMWTRHELTVRKKIRLLFQICLCAIVFILHSSLCTLFTPGPSSLSHANIRERNWVHTFKYSNELTKAWDLVGESEKIEK